jgi:hypothetical protein
MRGKPMFFPSPPSKVKFIKVNEAKSVVSKVRYVNALEIEQFIMDSDAPGKRFFK